DHNNGALSVTWSLNGQAVCDSIRPDRDGITTCDISLDEGQHSISMQVVDPEGASSNSDVQVDAYFVGIPEVVIGSPEDGSSFYTNQEIIFSATVSDLEDDPQDLSITWASSLDGTLSIDNVASSEGEVFGTGLLSEGTHQIEISVTDSDGNQSSDSVVIDILPPNTEPSCSLVLPATNSVYAQGDTIVFEGTVADAETSPSELIVELASDKDGVLGNPTADSSGAVQFSSNQLSPDVHSIIMRVTDDGQLSCTDSVSVSIQGTPQLLINAPLQADVYNEGDPVSFSATVTDVDTDPLDIGVIWQSSVNGLLRDTNADPSGTSVFQTAALMVGEHIISVTATDPDGNTASEQVDIRINDLPDAPALTYSPSPVYTLDDIVVAPTGSSDLEGDPISYVFTWFRNGNIDLAYTTDTLPSAATTRGDTWRVDVAASDGFGEGDVASLTVVVENTPPQVAAASLTPTVAFETTSLQCQASLPQDDDNDSISFVYVWTVNGNVVPVSSDMLDGAYFDKGDTVQCQLSPFDGVEIGNTVTSSAVTIQNSAPSIGSAIISPQSPSAADTLLCGYSDFIDPDGDASQSLFEWAVNGTPVGNNPSLSGSFGYGDVVVCSITPSDGEDDGVSVSTSVLIENTPPVLSSVEITPAEPYEGDTVYCSPGSTSDIDGTTSFTFTYTWEINGLPYNNVSSALTASEYQRDDIVRCFATPNDGVEDGLAVASDPVVIKNSLPTVGAVTISPTNIYASTALTCSYTNFYDADGDADQSLIDWTINGNYASSGPQLSTGYVYGDVVACTVTPSDGTEDGPSKSASVTVQNSAPSIALASVSPSNPVTGDTLTCSYSGFVDIDGHPDNSTFAWYVNGNLAGISDTLVGGFVGGDSVSCTVTPNDGITTGLGYTVTVPISNTPPVLSGATLSPTTPYEGDVITCTPGNVTDADGTILITYNYTWLIDGVDIGHNASTLNSNQFEHGNVISCLVSPNDGIDDGALVSAGSVIVANTIPSIASIAIAPVSPYADDTLTCSYPSVVDPDNDPDLSVIQWEVNGVVVGQ
ncbi:MAG: hypothetical protein VX026_05165, partial [Myxococcota bacterium]|nr:hypothetical protein [Myxococcota bacterium]